MTFYFGGHLLVPFLFHDLTSLHPPSFHGNDFCTCFTLFFVLGQSPMKICIQSSAQLASAACAHNIPGGNSKAHTLALFCLSSWKTPTANCAHAGHSENGVVQCLLCKGPRSTVEMYSKRKTIARCPCTPPLTLETFGEKISAKACSEGLFR